MIFNKCLLSSLFPSPASSRLSKLSSNLRYILTSLSLHPSGQCDPVTSLVKRTTQEAKDTLALSENVFPSSQVRMQFPSMQEDSVW